MWPRRPTPPSLTARTQSPFGSSSAAPGQRPVLNWRSSRPTSTTPSSPDREGETLELEADHRRHAEIENAIRDLKYSVGLNHLPSGKFAANGAWLAVQVIAHNLARWTARIGLKEGIVTTKTLRRRLFSLPGRLTRSARRVTLHLPARWPWAVNFTAALATLRAIPRLTPDHAQPFWRRSTSQQHAREPVHRPRSVHLGRRRPLQTAIVAPNRPLGPAAGQQGHHLSTHKPASAAPSVDSG